jgi:hypothetical protein
VKLRCFQVRAPTLLRCLVGKAPKIFWVAYSPIGSRHMYSARFCALQLISTVTIGRDANSRYVLLHPYPCWIPVRSMCMSSDAHSGLENKLFGDYAILAESVGLAPHGGIRMQFERGKPPETPNAPYRAACSKDERWRSAGPGFEPGRACPRLTLTSSQDVNPGRGFETMMPTHVCSQRPLCGLLVGFCALVGDTGFSCYSCWFPI